MKRLISILLLTSFLAFPIHWFWNDRYRIMLYPDSAKFDRYVLKITIFF